MGTSESAVNAVLVADPIDGGDGVRSQWQHLVTLDRLRDKQARYVRI
jgi:hypothetical protein